MQRFSILGTACRRLSRSSGSLAACISTPRWKHQLSDSTITQLVRPQLATTFRGQVRFSSNEADRGFRNPLTDRDDDNDADAAKRKADVEAYRAEQPSYQLTFTCAKCVERSTHRVSKQGYHSGTVLINCPGCKNKHLISDHLKIFSDRDITLEDIMKEKGQQLKKGVLGADGDVEFY